MRTTFAATMSMGLLLFGCKSKPEQSFTRRAVAGPASLRDVARLTGTVTPSDSIQIKSQITQQITKIHVKEGDFVKKGQLLFDLDREQLQLRHDQLLISVSTAKLTLQAAERDLDRSQVQLRNGSVSADHVQDLQFARDKAKLALQTAQLDLKSNERDLYYTRIVAPRDGQLIHLNVSEGEMAVAANSISGGVLGVIADPSRLKVVVEVSELDYPRLRSGQSVEVSSESRPDDLLPGHVTYIPPAAQASSSNASVMVFKVEVSLDKGGKPVHLADVASHGRGWARPGSDSTGVHPRLARGAGDTSHHRKRPFPGADSSLPSGKRHGQASNGSDTSSSKLAPGMTVNVDFVFLERKAEIAVPYDMVTTGKDGSTKLVWVRGGKPTDRNPAGAKPDAQASGPSGRHSFDGLHPKRVQVGSTDFKSIEILSGLEAGDTVFAAPDTANSKSFGRKGGPGGPPL